MSGLPDANAVLCALLIVILPLAPAGLAFVNTGLGRSRSAAQALLGALCLMSVAAISYCAVGSSLAGFAGGSAHSLSIGSTRWNWMGTGAPLLDGSAWPGGLERWAAAYQVLAVGLAALIPWGSGGERWRLGAACVSTAWMAAVIYPLFAHWVWGGGWLAQLGQSFHLGVGFADPGGAATIQALGGLTALAVVWILGPRPGKFSGSAPPAALPAHHIIYVLFGAAVMLVGWLGLNCLGALLFGGLGASGLATVEIDTVLSAAGALLAALLVTRLRFGKPDASLCVNGWTAGLVASSATAALVSPGGALLAGMVAGGALPLAIEFLEQHCGLDDPSGGIAVHGLAGLWGLLIAGVLAQGPPGQLVAQLVGIATLLGLIFPLSYGSCWLINRVIAFRTDREGERLSMDPHELGAGAYPEFVLHSDEFVPR